MRAHPNDGDTVERGVGLSVSTAVETLARGLAAGCRDGTDAAELGERGLGSDALWIVTENDQHLRDRSGGDAWRGHQCRRPTTDKRLESVIEFTDFRIKSEPAMG